MNRLEELEQILFDEDIYVETADMTFTALCIKAEASLILLKNKVWTENEKFLALKHEQAHLEHPRTLYDFDTSPQAIRNKETRTTRRLIKELIPRDKLGALIDLEYSVEDIADELNFPIDFIVKAIEYYSLVGW